MEEFIRRLPKAELHIHIEGALEPRLMFDLAARSGYELPYSDVESVAAAYRFKNLQSFLDIYYQGAPVQQTPHDLYELTSAYQDKAAADGVRRAEIFMEGFRSAIADAMNGLGVSAGLILCFLRHLGGDAALDTMRAAEPHLDGVIAVGLDSTEVGFHPRLFEGAFGHARELGLRAVAHAGEEGPPSYVTAALDILGAERIDHGVRSLEDPELVERLRRDRVPLTVCPLSNVALRVVDKVSDHPLPEMMEAGLLVSVNSDDPAYFGGYVGENYWALSDDLGFGEQRLAMLAANSIESSFIDEDAKTRLLEEIGSVQP
jgi:adenosine deaminase